MYLALLFIICKSLYDSLYKNSNISFKTSHDKQHHGNELYTLTVSACAYSWYDFSRWPWFNVYSEMGESLAKLDTFYMTNKVLLMMKRFYCHVYQGNSQGSGKLNDYSINNA